MTGKRVRVLDARGRELSLCAWDRAAELVAAGRAAFLPGAPPTVQLPYAVDRPAKPQRVTGPAVVAGTTLLLHICCGPCATYPVPYLRELGFEIVGWWYNPNIQPAQEHALREESAGIYARRVSLPMASGAYEPERFSAAARGQAERPERCRLCYRLRLEETAREAHRLGIGTISTTLLVSPYQDQAALREIGEEAAGRYGLRFYFENLRRGYAQRGRLAREYGLYLQQYCGCRYSLAERQRSIVDRPAPSVSVQDGIASKARIRATAGG